MENYSVSDFFMYLKLGIWKSGEVTDWGMVDRVYTSKRNENGNFEADNVSMTRIVPLLKKKPQYYFNQSFAKKMLANGIFLLDLYKQINQVDDKGRKQPKTYILIISTGRLGFENREYTHILKVSNYLDELDFTSLVNESKKVKKRKSSFRKK